MPMCLNSEIGEVMVTFFFEKLLSTCTFFFYKHTCITLKETYKGEYILYNLPVNRETNLLTLVSL